MRPKTLTQLTVTICLALLPLSAAAPAQAQRAKAWRGPERGPPELSPEMQRQIRARRAVALTTQLDLDEHQAVAKSAVMQQFWEQRVALKERTQALLQELAENENAEQARVLSRVTRLKELRLEMVQLSHAEFDALAVDLSPNQQARLVMFLRDFPRQLRQEARRRRREGQRHQEPGDIGPR